MSINLEDALDFGNASSNANELAMLKDLQGNILKGHGRKHTRNLFLVFDQNHISEVKTFIHNVAARITTAHKQLQDAKDRREAANATLDGGVFVCFFLSAAGYDVLGIPDENIPKGDAFRNGLKTRQDILSDPDFGTWDATFQNQIHAMILIGDANSIKADEERDCIISLMPTGVTLVGEEQGLAMKNTNGDGIEHFGYVDGRSQPLMLVEDVKAEDEEKDGIHIWNPRFPLKQALVECPSKSSPNSYGSYFVFRKLEQNVEGFKTTEDRFADDLGLAGDERELVGAMLVGRFEDGTPVVLQKGEGMHHPVPNNFDFSGDPAGNKCPFHAHIRKTNPRGQTVSLGATLDKERSHIMARRGITYGERKAQRDEKEQIIEFEDKPTGGVGLLFMAYQSDIENQFEFTQQSWANEPGFLPSNPATGIDPVIGQGVGASTPQQQPTEWGSTGQRQPISFNGFVSMKGGEYFFAPCISFLKTI